MSYKKGGASQGLTKSYNVEKLIHSNTLNITPYKTIVLSYSGFLNKVSDIQIKDEPWEEWHKVFKLLYPNTLDVINNSFVSLNGYMVPFSNGLNVVENWTIIDSDQDKISFGGEYDYEKVTSGGSIHFNPKMATGKYLKAEKINIKFVLPSNTGPRIREIYIEF